MCYNNLGLVHGDLGNRKEAEECQEHALAIRLKKLGPDHLDVATCYSNLGHVHRALGNLEQAKENHDRALTIRLNKLGPDHFDTMAQNGYCFKDIYLLGGIN